MWVVRGVLVAAVMIGSVVVGEQLRVARESVAARGTPVPSATMPAPASVTPAVVTPTPTALSTPTGTAPATASGATATTATRQPTPQVTAARPTATAAEPSISGRVLAGGGPLKNIEIRVFKADASANGPTPVPPEAGHTMTAPDGTYRVALPPGSYRVGAYIDETLAAALNVYWVTWYGDAYAIGMSRDVVVSGPTAGVDITMLRRVVVSGRVVGRDGVGVPGASVTTSRFLNVQYPIAGATTDAAGAFSFTTVAMRVTLDVAAEGKTGIVSASVDLDIRGDMNGLRYVVDRGNIVTGVLRDASGRPLADTNFGVVLSDQNIMCGASCNSRTDASGRYAMTLPTGALRFHTWPLYPNDPELTSKEYTINPDMSLEPLLAKG